MDLLNSLSLNNLPSFTEIQEVFVRSSNKIFNTSKKGILSFGNRSGEWFEGAVDRHPVLTLISSNVALICLAGMISSLFKSFLARLPLPYDAQEVITVGSFITVLFIGNVGLSEWLQTSASLTFLVAMGTLGVCCIGSKISNNLFKN